MNRTLLVGAVVMLGGLVSACGSSTSTSSGTGDSSGGPIDAVCAVQSAPIFTRIIVAGHYAPTVCADIAPGGNQPSTMILDGVDDPFTSSATSVPAGDHLACTIHRLGTTWWIETGGPITTGGQGGRVCLILQQDGINVTWPKGS